MSTLISKLILNWAVTTFGPVARDPAERAARLLEEAAEVAQSFGVAEETALKIIKRTYSRPVGDGDKEIGGVLVCVHGLCAIRNIDPDEVLETEVTRVLNRDPAYWAKKHADKVIDGTGNVSEQRCSCINPVRAPYTKHCRHCGLPTGAYEQRNLL